MERRKVSPFQSILVASGTCGSTQCGHSKTGVSETSGTRWTWSLINLQGQSLAIYLLLLRCSLRKHWTALSLSTPLGLGKRKLSTCESLTLALLHPRPSTRQGGHGAKRGCLLGTLTTNPLLIDCPQAHFWGLYRFFSGFIPPRKNHVASFCILRPKRWPRGTCLPGGWGQGMWLELVHEAGAPARTPSRPVMVDARSGDAHSSETRDWQVSLENLIILFKPGLPGHYEAVLMKTREYKHFINHLLAWFITSSYLCTWAIKVRG